MKRLQDKANVDAPSTAYPYGKQRNKIGVTPGTRWDVEQANDVYQLMEKMFDVSGLTANGQPDNATDGFQLFDALLRSVVGFKRYEGVIFQSGTAAPTVNLIGFNEIGNIVWTRVSVGRYRGTLAGAFTNLKTLCMAQMSGLGGGIAAGFIQFAKSNTDEVEMITRDQAGTLADSVLNIIGGSSFSIRVAY
jgi:hypothetical protein